MIHLFVNRFFPQILPKNQIKPHKDNPTPSIPSSPEPTVSTSLSQAELEHIWDVCNSHDPLAFLSMVCFSCEDCYSLSLISLFLRFLLCVSASRQATCNLHSLLLTMRQPQNSLIHQIRSLTTMHVSSLATTYGRRRLRPMHGDKYACSMLSPHQELEKSARHDSTRTRAMFPGTSALQSKKTNTLRAARFSFPRLWHPYLVQR